MASYLTKAGVIVKEYEKEKLEKTLKDIVSGIY